LHNDDYFRTENVLFPVPRFISSGAPGAIRTPDPLVRRGQSLKLAVYYQ
jgi:hypothetical protein